MPKSIYFVGIKGVAMSALACFYKEAGAKVTGSDVAEAFPTDEELAVKNIPVIEGFDVSHIKRPYPDLVVYTGAHGGRTNPEVVASAQAGIPIRPHAQALGEVMEGFVQVSVAGSHGKTTTSAMIAIILSSAGKDPSYAIGCGGFTHDGAAGHKGKGRHFVAEADEYVTDPGHDDTPRFLWQHPDVLVVTNIDYDHPDVFGSIDDVRSAVEKLVSQQKGAKILILNEDDPETRPLIDAAEPAALTFGFSPKSTVRVDRVAGGAGRTFFSLSLRGVSVGEFALKVPGRQNVANAAAAAAACFSLGLTWEEIRTGLAAFEGTKRRFERLGEHSGVVVFDDYAHHPKEIEATLEAARMWYPKNRIIAIFQPHTYSRTKALMHEFAKAFSQSDLVIICDIYASARETDTLGISGATLTAEAANHNRNVMYAKDYEHLEKEILLGLREGDILIAMGAGNIYSWIRDIFARMKGDSHD
jgi:UDP-N-acetylmuramate--alanine ligase